MHDECRLMSAVGSAENSLVAYRHAYSACADEYTPSPKKNASVPPVITRPELRMLILFATAQPCHVIISFTPRAFVRKCGVSREVKKLTFSTASTVKDAEPTDVLRMA